MRINAAFSLALLGSVPHALTILQKRENGVISAMNIEQSSLLEWGSSYVQVKLEETESGYMAHVFEHHGSCFIPGGNAGPNDSIYRFQKEVSTPEECQSLCIDDARCMLARHLGNEATCQFFDFSVPVKGSTEAGVTMINKSCDDACFVKNKKFNSELIEYSAPDALTCHNMCLGHSQCGGFSFNSADSHCVLSAAGAEAVDAVGWTSGPGKPCSPTAEVSETSCHIQNISYLESYSTAEASDATGCHKACNGDSNCSAWTFVNGACQLHNGGQSLQSTKAEGAVSGPYHPCTAKERAPRALYTLNASISGLTTLMNINNVETLVECETFCQKRRRCVGFTFDFEAKTCKLSDYSAYAPKTATTFTSEIAGIVDGYRQAQVSRYVGRPAIKTGEVLKLNYLQCVLSARQTPNVVSFAWANGECHHLTSAVQTDAQSEDGDNLVYGEVTPLTQHEQSSSCYVENTGVMSDVSLSFNDLETPEACESKCKEHPWCMGTNWQSNNKMCHLIDNIKSFTQNYDDKLAPKSCDSSCFDQGYVYEAPVLEETSTPSASICQLFCQSRKFCVTFSYNTSSKQCTLHSAKGDIVKNQDTISGPKMYCDAPHMDIRYKLQPVVGWQDKTHNVILRTEKTENADECKQLCDREPQCAMSTFIGKHKECDLKPEFRRFKQASQGYNEVSMLKIDNIDCYHRGTMPRGARQISQGSYSTLSECATVCISLEGCHGLLYAPEVTEGTTCRLYDLEGFRVSTHEGDQIVSIIGPCA